MPRRVLVVDDHAGFRRLASALLAAHGLDVVGEARDAATAREAVARLAPDLVLLDVQLPDEDGITLACELHAIAATPKVVLTSSREAADYGRRLRDAPVAGFVPKSGFSGAAVMAAAEGR